MKQNYLIITFELLFMLTACSAFHVSNTVAKKSIFNYPFRHGYYLSRVVQKSANYIRKDHNGNVQHLETTISQPLDDTNYIYDNIDPAIRVPDCQAQAKTVWKDCFVPNLLQSQYGLDQSIQWSSSDNVYEITNQLLNKLNIVDTTKRIQLQRDLVQSMIVFTKFCQNNFVTSNQPQQQQKPTYKARIVCSRGQVASSKCPRWHIDHVPVRWIQSLVGPGVMWVNSDAVLWNTFTTSTNNDDNDNDDENDSLLSDRIDNKLAIIYQAKEGEAVMIQGNRWNEFTSTEKIPYPVVHKSPTGLFPWDGRVLFTMDVEFQ